MQCYQYRHTETQTISYFHATANLVTLIIQMLDYISSNNVNYQIINILFYIFKLETNIIKMFLNYF